MKCPEYQVRKEVILERAMDNTDSCWTSAERREVRANIFIRT